MYGPYGKNASMYYGHAAYPRAYAWNWRGMPMPGQRGAVSRGLGEYPTFPVSMSAESGRRSVLHSGPEQTHIYDAPYGSHLAGIPVYDNLSNNEKLAVKVVGAAVVGYFGYQLLTKKRR